MLLFQYCILVSQPETRSLQKHAKQRDQTSCERTRGDSEKISSIPPSKYVVGEQGMQVVSRLSKYCRIPL